VSFDVDVQVNVFEANIRLLGGLLSAHLLATDARSGPPPSYRRPHGNHETPPPERKTLDVTLTQSISHHRDDAH